MCTLHEAVDQWEGGLTATAGAIVTEKTFWYLIDFAWKGGSWRYKSIAECPGELSAKDLQGTRKAIRRVEVSSAEETLGIFLARTGSQDGQIRKLKHKVQEWLDQLALGRLSRSELWTGVQSTIIRTLSYPLPALALSRKECEKPLQMQRCHETLISFFSTYDISIISIIHQ